MASAGMMVCIGRLRGPNVLGCAGSTTKPAPRLVQHDAGLLGADADAEGREQRIDQRHRHAVAVDHREVDRVAAGRRRTRQRRRGVRGRCGRRARRRKRLSSSAGTDDAHVRRVGDMGVAHRIGEPRRFERKMEALGADADRARARSKRSRMLSSTSAVRPCPFGGNSSTSSPR